MSEAPAPVTHANQLRSAKFKELIRRKRAWLTISIVCLLIVAVFAAGGAWFIGIPIAAVVALIGLLIVFLIADSRAEDAFYDSYCDTHGLTRVENPNIGSLTPLLRKGDERQTDEIFHGELAPGVEGDLVLFTYTEVTHDSKGNRQETNYPYTLIHVEMPEIVDHLPELRVQNKAGFKFFEGVEDKFRLKHERVTLESEALRDRFEIFVLKEQDQVWVRRVFSPSFIVWLTEKPPKKFAFELENGHLIAYVPKHKDDTEGLEEMTRFGIFVADRLLTEVAETSPVVERETT